MRRIPPEVRAAARRMRTAENASAPTIARALGICNHTTYAILRDMGPWNPQGRAPYKREYTAAEIAALRQLYPAAPKAEICAALPQRDWLCIVRKANSLGLKRERQPNRPPGLSPLIVGLRDAREARRVTRVTLARLLAMPASQLAAYEIGKRPPVLRRLVQWASALDLDIVLQPRNPGGTDG